MQLSSSTWQGVDKIWLAARKLDQSRQEVEILNLHHHVCDMVDRATLHYVTGTFPEINDKLIQLINPMFLTALCFQIYAIWVFVRPCYKSCKVFSNQTLGRADNQKCSRPQRCHESVKGFRILSSKQKLLCQFTYRGTSVSNELDIKELGQCCVCWVNLLPGDGFGLEEDLM